MLAKTRPYFLLAFVALASWGQARAQVQANPSSGSSFGDAESSAYSGRANLASLRANGIANPVQPFLGNCCAISFVSPSGAPEIKPPFAPGYRHHRDDDNAPAPIVVPVYIPYAIGYEPDEIEAGKETAADESTLAYGPGQVVRDQSGPASDDASSAPPASDAETAAVEPPEPVVPQPATELVYKDGHHAKVVNYAILGDALFDFDNEHTSKIPLADLDLAATEKVNDAAGVDFKLPASMITSAP